MFQFSKLLVIFVGLKFDFASENFQMKSKKKMFYDTDTQRQKTPLEDISSMTIHPTAQCTVR